MKKIIYILFIVCLSSVLIAEDKKEQLSPEAQIILVNKIVQKNPNVARAMIKGLINDLEKQKNTDKKILAEAYCTLGDVELIAENFKDCFKWYDTAIKIQSNYFEAIMMRGRCYFGYSRFNDARLDYEKAKKLDPENKRLKKYMKQMEDYLKANPDAEDLSESLKK